MKGLIYGFLLTLPQRYAKQANWFCENYWWVIVLLISLAGSGWILEWDEKQDKKEINGKRA